MRLAVAGNNSERLVAMIQAPVRAMIMATGADDRSRAILKARPDGSTDARHGLRSIDANTSIGGRALAG